MTLNNSPSQGRPHAIVTGATSGIGRHLCLMLGASGFDVTILGRNQAALNLLRSEFLQSFPGQACASFCGDLSQRYDVEKLGVQLQSHGQAVDLLIHNAGLICDSHSLNDAGWERTIAVNHFAPFILTRACSNLLRPRDAALVACRQAKVLVVASQAHRFADLQLDDMQWRHRKFRPYRVYATSKLCNLLFARRLQRQVESQGIRVISWHPGVVASNFGAGQRTWLSLALKLARPFLRTPQAAAANATSICCAEDPIDLARDYFVKDKCTPGSSTSRNAHLADSLWQFTVEALQR